MSIDAMRREYGGEPLDPRDVGDDPMAFFGRWFEQASERVGDAANTMCLATVDARGRPSARMVLLKGYSVAGFVFYTNRASPKGRDLAARPHAALCFYWLTLDRQVRIEGAVEDLSEDEVERYFASRPRASRLAAIASPQSEVIAGRDELEARYREVEREYADAEPPKPTDWGGYRVVPDRIEFWQGQPSRLHDRVRCWWEGVNWRCERLAP